MPRERLDRFLLGFHGVLGAGAEVVLVDNVYVEGQSTPVSRVDSRGNTFQVRRLEDGSVHEVLKNFHSPEELRTLLGPVSTALELTVWTYYWCASYRIKPRSEPLRIGTTIGVPERGPGRI